MLVLTRQLDQEIIIGDDIVVTVVAIRHDKVRLGIKSPAEVPIHRREVYEAILREKRLGLTGKRPAEFRNGAATAEEKGKQDDVANSEPEAKNDLRPGLSAKKTE